MLNKQRYETHLQDELMTRLKGFLLITTLLLSSLFGASTSAAPLNVIVNASVKENNLKLKDLRSIYTMKKNLWSNGDRISVFVLSDDSATHKEFCRNLLKVFPRQLESVWYRLVYSGTGEQPVSVSSEQEMIKLVSKTPGAIGYIRSENPHEETKIITIK